MSTIKKLLDNPIVATIVKIIKNKYLVVTIAFILFISFIDTNNLISLFKDLREVAAQERQKKYYREAIIKADENLQELSSNKDSLERFAREQFFFHEADEDVFVVEE